MMVSYIVSRVVVVGLGTLYPAYRSYKAIKSKDTKEYVKWMMYWIIFAIFTAAEVFIDTLVGFWLPFYYEIKILFLLWILSPTTKGSSILYRKFVHPFFTQYEKDIDSYIDQAKEQGYGKLMQYGKKGLDLAAETMMKTAITSQDVFVQQLRRYRSDGSLDQLGRPDDPNEASHDLSHDELDMAPTNTEQKQKSKHARKTRSARTVERVDKDDSIEATEPTITADSARVAESTNLTHRGRTQAQSMDDVHVRSSMTTDSSLLYDSNTLPRRYYDGNDPSLRSRPTSYYEGSSTLPRNFSTSSYTDYSTRPYETSDFPLPDYTSNYRYESSTLPRSRDSSRRYNTRSGKY